MIVFCLISMVLLPPTLWYLQVATSYSLGTVFAACLIVMTCTVCGAHIGRRSAVLMFFAALVVCALGVWQIAASVALEEGAAGAVLMPLPAFAVLFLAAIVFGEVLSKASGREVQRALLFCFYFHALLFCCAIVADAWLESSLWRQPIFPFSEPSAFVLSIFPFAIYCAVFAPKKHRFSVFLLMGSFLLFHKSLTMVVVLLIIAAFLIRNRGVVLFFASVVFFGLSSAPYYASRLHLSELNVSALVFARGYEAIWLTFRDGYWLGCGFFSEGICVEKGRLTQKIVSLVGENTNASDLGFLSAKLVAEQGLLGAFLVVFYVATFLRSIVYLRSAATKAHDLSPGVVFAHCSIVALSIEMFLRGTGYFTSGVFFALVGYYCASEVRLRQRQLHGGFSNTCQMGVR